jgi:hypothetical protein
MNEKEEIRCWSKAAAKSAIMIHFAGPPITSLADLLAHALCFDQLVSRGIQVPAGNRPDLRFAGAAKIDMFCFCRETEQIHYFDSLARFLCTYIKILSPNWPSLHASRPPVDQLSDLPAAQARIVFRKDETFRRGSTKQTSRCDGNRRCT